MGERQIKWTMEIWTLRLLNDDEENISNQEETTESSPIEDIKEKLGTLTINLGDSNNEEGVHEEAPLY